MSNTHLLHHSDNDSSQQHYATMGPSPAAALELNGVVEHNLEEGNAPSVETETESDTDADADEKTTESAAAVVPPLTREEIAFLRDRSLDSRSVTVLLALCSDEIERVRRLIKSTRNEENEVSPLEISFVVEDSRDEEIFGDGVDDIDVDGLARCEPMPPEHRWPFKRRQQQQGSDEEGVESSVDKNLFFEAISCHDKGESQAGYARAIARYKVVITTEPKTGQDRMFQMFAFVNLGILRMTSMEYKDESEAVQCFKRAAVAYGEPVSMYFYGRSLVHGAGGIRRDIPRGIRLLNKAGAKGIGQSFFELGSIYESGVSSFTGGSVDKREARARDFYMAAGKSYARNTRPLGDWTSKLYAAHTFTADVFHLQDLLPTDIWHGVEDVLGSGVGNRFNWSIAGQAFLFGAASSLSSNRYPAHYAPLLVLLPILGMILALFSMMHIIEAMYRNERRRGSILEMLDAKIEAYRCHVTAAENATKENSDRFKDSMEEVSNRRKQLDRHENAINHLKKLSSFIEAMILALATAFFAAWLILFINEAVQLANNCSNWWHGTCS